MARRPHDFYETADWQVRALLENTRVAGSIFEPCAGDGAIVDPLRRRGYRVTTNDLDPVRQADFNADATQPDLWQHISPDWTITNPPFSHAEAILRRALDTSRVGVAFLLRLSFLEPTRSRGPLLVANPPTSLIVLPRHSFTGDGKTDSVTCAWMVWAKDAAQTIVVIPRAA